MAGRTNLIIYIVYFFLFFISVAVAQPDSTDTDVMRITLKDNTVLICHILSEDSTSVQIITLSNIEMNIPKRQISEREVVSGLMVKGEIWEDDPNRTRLLFSPTGRALKAGQGYFSVYEIFFPFLAVGLTDNITLSGGMSLFPGTDQQLFYLAPKITPLQLDNFDLSGGVLYIRVPEESEGAGIVYSVATLGSTNGALTFGLGYGFLGGDFAEHPVLMLGGELRASKSVKFITENWIFAGSEVSLISLALRFFGKNLAGDFGFFIPVSEGDSVFIPWLGFAYNFSGD